MPTKMWARLREHLIPVGLRYLAEYLESIEVIERFRKVGPVTESDRISYGRVRRRITLSSMFIAFKCLHLTYLFFCPSRNPLEAALYADLVAICGLDRLAQLMLMLFFALFIYYYRMIYINYHPVVLKMGRQALMGQGDAMLKQSHGKQAPPLFRVVALLTVNAFQGLVVVVHFFSLFVQYHCLSQILSLSAKYPSSLSQPLPINFYLLTVMRIIVFEAHFILTLGAFYFINHVGILMMGLAAPICLSGFLLLYQTGSLLERLMSPRSRARWFRRHLARFLVSSRQVIILILHVNTFFGKALLGFLLVNAPSNCYLMVVLSFGYSLDLEYFFFVGVFAAHQWIVTFGFHLVLVRFNRHIQLPIKPLFYLHAHRRRILKSFRHNLSLSHYLQAFHTNKRYGITYGSFGIVSLLSFTKFIALYIQYMMYLYMITRT